MTPEHLLGTLGRNLDIIRRDAANVSDAVALKRIGTGSSLNWVVGHILSSRTRILDVLGIQDRTFQHDDIRALYGRDTQPDAVNSVPLSELLRLLESTQGTIAGAIKGADLSTELDSPFGRKTRAELIDFFAWHEGYHAGQVIVFRRWLEA